MATTESEFAEFDEARSPEVGNYIATTESELTEHSDADRDEDSAGEALS